MFSNPVEFTSLTDIRRYVSDMRIEFGKHGNLSIDEAVARIRSHADFRYGEDVSDILEQVFDEITHPVEKLPPGYKVFQAKEMPRFGEFDSEVPANVDLWAFQPESFEGRWYSSLFLTRNEAVTEAWRDFHLNEGV